jgi:hypothetical protein
MYHVADHRDGYDNFSCFAVFPVRDASFDEIEYQFGQGVLYVVVQILKCSLEKRFQYLPTLLFL